MNAPLLEDLLKFALTMFSILNPLGAIPIFLSLTQDRTHKEVKRITSISAISVLITLLCGFFIGKTLLEVFGISIASFRVGGGILLGIMAADMLAAKPMHSKMNPQEAEQLRKDDPIGVVPLAIPLLAGPGSISTSILYSSMFTGWIRCIGVVFVLLLIVIATKYILLFSERIGKRMGPLGLNVMTRIMGLITMALAVEFVAIGLKELFPFLNQI